MQRLFLTLAVFVPFACLEMPASLYAQEDPADINARGRRWAEQGEYDKAIADFTEAIRIERETPSNLPIYYYNRAGSWIHKGEYDKGIADCNHALRLDSSGFNGFAAYNNRADAYLSKHEYDKAIADSTEAIRLNPSHGTPYINRAKAWLVKGEYDKATADLDQASRLSDEGASNKDYGYYQTLGWFEATCPDQRYRDGQKAFQNANKAYQLSGGKDAEVIDTLAAAYAECGDFAKAREWEGKAIELSIIESDKEEYRARLELYKKSKPYRVEPQK